MHCAEIGMMAMTIAVLAGAMAAMGAVVLATSPVGCAIGVGAGRSGRGALAARHAAGALRGGLDPTNILAFLKDCYFKCYLNIFYYVSTKLFTSTKLIVSSPPPPPPIHIFN